jgi:hypothetical protein
MGAGGSMAGGGSTGSTIGTGGSAAGSADIAAQPDKDNNGKHKGQTR